MQAKRESARRGQESGPAQPYAPIASNAAPAIARPVRQPLHFACDRAIDGVEALYGMRTPESPARQADRALAISAPVGLAGNPQDAQKVANGSFGSTQTKQRQR
jgi:hypothetical protein